MKKQEINRDKTIIRTSIIGILGNVLLVGFKAAIGLIVGSIAIVLDAVNNLTDALSSNSVVIFPRFHYFEQSYPKDIYSSASFCALNYEGRPLAGYIYIEANLTNIEVIRNAR